MVVYTRYCHQRRLPCIFFFVLSMSYLLTCLRTCYSYVVICTSSRLAWRHSYLLLMCFRFLFVCSSRLTSYALLHNFCISNFGSFSFLCIFDLLHCLQISKSLSISVYFHLLLPTLDLLCLYRFFLFTLTLVNCAWLHFLWLRVASLFMLSMHFFVCAWICARGFCSINYIIGRFLMNTLAITITNMHKIITIAIKQ